MYSNCLALSNSFQRLINTVCAELPFVTVYLDDLLVYSASKEKISNIKAFFDKISAVGQFFRRTKCHIALSQVFYLGHVFSAEGMKPDMQKICAIQEWRPPTDVSNLQSFLGLASYYRHYIPCFQA